MTEYGLNLYWKSLFARIATLERYGVKFLLCEDGEELEIQIPRALRGTGIREGVRNDKQSLLEAVRLREGLCVTCGMDMARRPARKGFASNWDWGTLSAVEGECSSLAVYPMYCASCWESRLFWRDVVEKKRAKSEEAGKAKTANGDPTPLRREEQTSADFGGDSGGDGVDALSFRAH